MATQDIPDDGAKHKAPGKAPFFERHAAAAIFMVLFILNVFSLLMISQVNRLLQEGYSDLARAHDLWSMTNHRAAAMTKAAREANAPGNEVFNSQRLEIERGKLDENLRDLFGLIDKEKAEIGRLGIASVRTRLDSNIAKGEKPLQRMAEASQQIFHYLHKGD